MDAFIRLTRRPFTSVLWLFLVTLMTGFMTVGASLSYSSERLSAELDKSHTAVAVRSDPAVNRARTADGLSFEIPDRTFGTEDASFFASLDSVKAVRSHTLTGGYSSDFYPITGINKHRGYYAPGNLKPYNCAIIAGTVRTVGRSADPEQDSMLLEVALDEVLYMSEEYKDAREHIEYTGTFIVDIDLCRDPSAAELFTRNESGDYGSFVFGGRFFVDAGRYNSDPRAWYFDTRFFSYVLDAGVVFREGDLLTGGHPIAAEYDEYLPEAEKYPAYSFPAAQKYEGSAEEFLNDTNNAVWRDLAAACEKQYHSLPVIGTDRLESFFTFLRGDAVILEGRSFTAEEYEKGSRSIVISETIASRAGLSVGDKISMSQFECAGSELFETNPSTVTIGGRSLNNPSVDSLNMDREYFPAEEYEIVGIYRLQADWTFSAYSITPNTVFIPRSAQAEGAFGGIEDGKDVYGIYLSIELNNGMVDDFRLALAESPYAGQFYSFDQGFEEAQKNLNALSASSRRLFLVAALGWLLFLMLYMIMYQGSEKWNMGVMRSLGASKGAAVRYLFGSGGLLALVGVSVGAVISGFVFRAVEANILSSTLASVDRSAYGGALAITEEELAAMVHASSPDAKALLIIAAVQLAVMSAVMLVQAVTLAGKDPRRLTEA